MLDQERINPGHTSARQVLRVVGPLLLVSGLVLTAIGMISFFTAFGGGGPPSYFWCAFVGLPLAGVGLMLCQFGFMGAITRYQAGEIAPVGKDTFNYMADGTKQGVRTVASAIGAGLAEVSNAGTAACPACGDPNDRGAKFCDQCGAALSKPCPACGETNDGDAKFCDGCGTRLATKA